VAAADDRLEATLAGGGIVNLAAGVLPGGNRAAALLRPVPGGQPLTAELAVSGDLGRWQARLEPLAAVAHVAALSGAVKASATLAADGAAWQVTRAAAECEKLEVALPERRVSEPRALVAGSGRWQPATGLVEIASAELLTPTLSLRTGGLSILPGRPAGSLVDAVIDRLRGKVQWQADVGRLEGWVVPPQVAARWPTGGRAWGTAELLDTPIGLNLLVEATGSQLALAGPPGAFAAAVQVAPPRRAAGADERPVTLWSEPRAAVTIEVTRPTATTDGGQLIVNRLQLESSTLAVAAAGSVADWETRRRIDIGGNVAYDWEQVSRLLAPWTGGRVKLSGGGARPFAVRGPLGAAAPAVAVRGDGGERVPLPDEWLAASGGTPGTLARLPVARGPRRSDDPLAERLRNLSLETTATWTAADVAGFRFEPGEMPLKFFEGQLALGPFELAAAGGRLRGSPWVRMLPGPVELVVPPGRCIDRVVLTREVCDRWVKWLLPLVGHSARMQGFVSVDSAGARVPLADPFAGEASGQVIFENLEAVPAETVQPLVNLLVRLQTAIDPRFAFGDKAVLLRVRPDPVRVRLVDRRLWHDGLVIDSGALVVRSAGSVAADGTLAMNVEVGFRGDIAGASPVVGKLLRTPLVLPLKGTVDRPQFDPRALEMTLARIVENTADAVFNEGIGKGLEAIFGNPAPPTPPPPAPPPLSFPAPAK
jgi:translocation and assembly module TamB